MQFDTVRANAKYEIENNEMFIAHACIRNNKVDIIRTQAHKLSFAFTLMGLVFGKMKYWYCRRTCV